jgi:UDP-N-acetylglucosamine acyltransferase
MARIHPTAIVDPLAKLHESVHVGAYSIIEGPVVIGAGCRIQERVSIRGPLTMGEGNEVFPGACLGFSPQDRKFDSTKATPGVLMGDHNIIREGVTIHGATGKSPTTIGNKNMLLVNSHVGHDTVVGNNCALINGALLAGHVTIYDNVTISGNAGVHQFCRVGRMAMLSGMAGVTQDVPPFCTVYRMRRVSSLNLVGLRRAGYRESVEPLTLAFKTFFKQRFIMTRSLDMIMEKCGHDPLCREFVDFIRETKRGITGYGYTDEDEDEG